MNSILVTILVSAIVAVIFFSFQWKFFTETRKYRGLFRDFFKKNEPYSTFNTYTSVDENSEIIAQMKKVGDEDSDLNNLIGEINHYVMKTRGTTDFAVIQNKVERKLNMRYDQSTAKLAFPTYLGLMGTFSGVFLGILMFVFGFDGVDGITDQSITNLLIGVLVSMSTSFIGLLLTTINNASSAEARKKIEEDKNEFYDFMQTELMPNLDVSMVLAITRLHETVDKFEPAFDGVISRFQQTFDRCTKAFGDSFEKNVTAVADAVQTMGTNMDKINKNIQLQEQLLDTLRSGDMVKGMDKYVEAAHQFVGITQSLNKFEEARRMLLAATQEAINLQNQYSESLKVPREVAVRVNQILDRIKTFEESVNRIGGQLNNREVLGNDVVNAIGDQIRGITKKGKIADKYLEMADGKLEDLFSRQTQVINDMNNRYSGAIASHIDGFEEMLKQQTAELEKRHKEFLQAIEDHLSVEEVHKDFSNLKKLSDILEQLKALSKDPVKSEELNRKLQKIQEQISKIELTIPEGKGGFSIFGGGSSNTAELKELRTENIRLQGEFERVQKQLTQLVSQQKPDLQKENDELKAEVNRMNKTVNKLLKEQTAPTTQKPILPIPTVERKQDESMRISTRQPIPTPNSPQPHAEVAQGTGERIDNQVHEFDTNVEEPKEGKKFLGIFRRGKKKNS